MILNPKFWLTLLLTGLFFGGTGYIKGRVDEQSAQKRKQLIVQTERATNAEKQRDIANAAPASVDCVLDWLSGNDCQ